MPIDTSRSLLDRIIAGDSDDWHKFVEIYRPLILKYLSLRGIPSSDLEDVCQEALAQVFRSIGDFRHNGHAGAFRKWLKIIVLQKAWNCQQANQSKPSSIPLDCEPLIDVSGLEKQWDQEHDRYVVNRLLLLIRREFSDSSWHAFRMIAVEGIPAREAAARLAISVNAALIAKSRMMRRLRQLGQGLVDSIQYESEFQK